MGGASLFLVGMQRAFTPQSLTIHCDPRWPLSLQKSLVKDIESVSIRTTGAQALCALLQQDYPLVKDVAISYKSPYNAQVKLVGWLPHLLVRSSRPQVPDYVLCVEGRVFEKSCFSQESVEGLPTLLIEGQDFSTIRSSTEFLDTALKLPIDYFEQYTIVWRSKTEILLYNKEKKIMIIADIHSIHEPMRFSYVERIYAQEENYHTGMKADIRLKDSIVCAPLTNHIYEK
jgi:hypothetical protein